MKILITLALALTAVASQAALYDFATDFSITGGNPNGAWSYGYRATETSARVLADTPEVRNDYRVWSKGGANAAEVFKYTGNGTTNGISSGQAALHPGPAGQLASVLFTVPQAGDLTMNVSFLAGDGTFSQGNTDHYIRINGTTVHSVTNTFYASNYTTATPMTVRAGDTIEFLVGRGLDGYEFDTTPLQASLNIANPVPEPATIAALGLGIALLRRRRSS